MGFLHQRDPVVLGRALRLGDSFASALAVSRMRAEAALVVDRQYKRDKDGQFSSTGGGGAKTPEQLHDEATIRETFGFQDEKTGLTATVAEVIREPYGTEVRITITDRDGNPVGQAIRTVKPPGDREVHHDLLDLEPGFQGQGFATRYTAQLEQAYREHGIEVVTSLRNIDVGGYAGARSGEDFADYQSRRWVADRALDMSRRWNPEVQEQVRRVADNPKASPIDFAMIGYEAGASTWPGKQIMLNSRWESVKYL